MINKWSVSNFKSILHAELELAPLTIFAGTSNAGKSSFLQSMLLTAQNLQDKLRGEIRLNGKYIELGNFMNIYSIYAGSDGDQKKITIKYGISPVKTAARPGLNIVDKPDFWDLEMVPQGGPEPEWEPLESVSGGFSISMASNSWIVNKLKDIMPGGELDIHKFNDGMLPFYLRFFEEFRRGVLSTGLLETRLDGVFRDNGKQRNIFIKSGERFIFDENCVDPYSLSQCQLKDIPETIKWRDKVKLKTNVFVPDGLVYTADAYEEDIWDGKPFLVLADFDAANPAKPIRDIRISKNLLKTLVFLLEDIIEPTGMIEKIEEMLSEGDGINLSDWYRLCLELPVEKRKLLREKLSPLGKVRVNPPPSFLHIDLPGELKTASECVYRYFSYRFKYIKPLREDPKIHTLVPLDANPSDIGTKGEYLVYVLSRNKNRYVKTIDPDYFDEDRDTSAPYKIKRRWLLEAVTSWAKYIGIAEYIDTSPFDDMRKPVENSGIHYATDYTIRVKPVGGGKAKSIPYYMDHYLTNVGTGVSQALPIIVACLMAGEDSTIVIEQPEYQLHAKSQSRLADFFLAMALCGRQCIIETHSEHIVNRLRRRMAEAPGDSLCDVGKIYFAELDDGITRFKEIGINKFGMFSDWPEDFFDERTKSSDDILYAAAKKREKARDREAEKNNG